MLSTLLLSTAYATQLLNEPLFLNAETEITINSEEALQLVFWDCQSITLINEPFANFLIKKLGIEEYYPVDFEKYDPKAESQVVYYRLLPCDRILKLDRRQDGTLTVKLLSLKDGIALVKKAQGF
jgi:hypothetical protein